MYAQWNSSGTFTRIQHLTKVTIVTNVAWRLPIQSLQGTELSADLEVLSDFNQNWHVTNFSKTPQ